MRSGRLARVLAVFEAGRGGEAVVLEASELVGAGAELWVVTLAPQARPYRCCGGGGAGPYNCAVRGQADEELSQARSLLGSAGARATFTTLVGIPQPPLAAWVTEHVFDIVLVPRHRLARGGSRLARDLRRTTGAEARAIG
jgi:hypothetical protein